MPSRHSIVHGASQDRLDKLIAERRQPGADKDSIDRRIWDLFGEEWCIMATDLVGFSRGVAEFGIIHFLQTIAESERILVPIIEEHDGILLKIEGDSFLVIFRSVAKALHASVTMQRTLRVQNEDLPPNERILLGVGLGFGRVLHIGDAEVYGNEVNSACILGESTSGAYEILMTKAVREALGEETGEYRFEELSAVPPGAGAVYRVIY